MIGTSLCQIHKGVKAVLAMAHFHLLWLLVHIALEALGSIPSVLDKIVADWGSSCCWLQLLETIFHRVQDVCNLILHCMEALYVGYTCNTQIPLCTEGMSLFHLEEHFWFSTDDYVLGDATVKAEEMSSNW